MPKINFGVPYKGSKNLIANKIVDLLPTGNTLYDVFAGGCAVTHCAYLRHKFNNYVVNDLNDIPSLFVRALSGEKFGSNWVSRAEFFAKKDTDPYVRMCWSFGNNGCDYIYSRNIEPYKKALHYAVIFNDFDRLKVLCPEVHNYVREGMKDIDIRDTKARRKQTGKLIVEWIKAHGNNELIQSNPLYKSIKVKHNQPKELNSLQSLESLQRLQSLESLQSLQSLESLERLERLQRLQSLERLPITVKQGDYRELKFNDLKGVIYCDPPYKNTSKYGQTKALQFFDYNAFYLWCEQQILPVYISEYYMPEDRFLCIAEFEKQSTICATKSKKVIERVYRPWAQLR